MSQLRIIAAFVLAPGLFPLGLVASGSGNWEQLAAFVIAGYAYAATIVVGIPGFLLLRTRQLLNLWIFTLGASVIGVVPGIVFINTHSLSSQLFVTASFAGIGAFTGLSFWLIGFWRPKFAGR